jgi:hypothetical protein
MFAWQKQDFLVVLKLFDVADILPVYPYARRFLYLGWFCA